MGVEDRKLNFYNWDTFIGNKTLAGFKAATDIEVEATVFATSDEMFGMVQHNHRYDVIVPSGDVVERMLEAKTLMPLDHGRVLNIGNVSPEFRNPPYDPWCAHSAPYTWDVIGIGYRKSKVDGVPDSWKWLFDSDRYAGRIALMSDTGALFRCAFKYLGQSANAVTPANVASVEALIARQKPHVMNFHEDNGQDLLARGAADLVMEYNGDIAQLMEDDDDIGFVVPKEGSLRECNTWAIPVGAPHPRNAHAFINFMLDAKVGAEIASTIRYATPNAAAIDLMPDGYKNSPAIFPPAEVLATCEYAKYAGEELTLLMEEAMVRARATYQTSGKPR